MTPEKDTADLQLQSYGYELPEELIAQTPANKRGESRLLVYNRSDKKVRHDVFSKLRKYVPENALLVVNNSRVLPARITGKRSTGGKVEFLLLTPLPLIEAQAGQQGDWCEAVADGLMKSSKQVKPRESICFSDKLIVQALERKEYGQYTVRLQWRGELMQAYSSIGATPLPPYIQRDPDQQDAERYQTVYAQENKTGSVAAPTAGLHFTPEHMQSLRTSGLDWAEVTLYVGYGTFSPVRCEQLADHAMHAEYYEITQENAAKIRAAQKDSKPVVAVGTTTVRVLESVQAKCGAICADKGWTDIFIYPGFQFMAVDHLVTNFHLPRSSLLMLVAAFAGRNEILNVYKNAIEKKYRFFSYGDAMLLL